MEGMHAYVSLQGIINDCYDYLVPTLNGEGLACFQDQDSERSYVRVDHFGFVRDTRRYMGEREAFYQRVSHSNSYAEGIGFATIGRQSEDSNLKWDGQRLENLVLLGTEAWGVTTGYLAITVPNLDLPADRLRELGIKHTWPLMFGERCIFTEAAGSRLPKFRLCIFEKSIQNMRSNLEPMRF